MGVVKLRFSPVMHFTTETSVMVIFISGDADNCTENDSFLHFDFITVTPLPRFNRSYITCRLNVENDWTRFLIPDSLFLKRCTLVQFCLIKTECVCCVSENIP